jgi:hypothetical protein
VLAGRTGLGCDAVRVQARRISSRRHVKTSPSTSTWIRVRPLADLLDWPISGGKAQSFLDAMNTGHPSTRS